MSNDPDESEDLSASFEARVADMRSQLHEWYDARNAKFLRASAERPEFGEPLKPDEAE